MTFKESIDVKKLINKQTKSVGKVAIQGYEGSFHQITAKQYFGENVKILPCANFRDVVKLASSKKDSIGGVMAIENSIVGSILPNYTLLEKSNLKIVGEVYLKIEQHLMIYPGTKFEDIKEVHSHPMALLQCLDYLEKHNWKLIETEDTALSAKNISKKHSQHVAVIASQLAADLFDLEVVAPNIHTEKNNFTRFLILQPNDKNIIAEDANKASINFKTNHTKGSLAKVLTTISNNGINLSKLQSMPIVGTNFKYSFHADLEFKNIEQFNKAITAITALTEEIKIYGIYKDGNINE